jgi:hypothetical protein
MWPPLSEVSYNSRPMLTEWSLHYPRWVIEDGYPYRDVGATFEWFNVDFNADPPLAKTAVRYKSAVPIADFGYRITGEVECLSEEGCLLDFGLRAMSSRTALAPDCKQGDYVTGEIAISLVYGIMYLPEAVFETLKCRWHVNRITADLTPYVSHPDNPRFFLRDETRIQYADVRSTLEVKAKDYILHWTEDR